jgi:hypothetical protein
LHHTGSRGGGGGGSGGQQPFAYTRNMGTYCWSCGFYSMGANHTSATCIKKKDNHKDSTTWSERMGGDKCWPKANRVKPDQQRHVSYKDRSTPIWRGQGLDKREEEQDEEYKAAIF